MSTDAQTADTGHGLLRALAELAESGLLDSPTLDRPGEESFDRLMRLAAKLLDAPVAFVSLVDDDRQHLKSWAGTGAAAGRRESTLSLCQEVVARNQPLVVGDLRGADPGVTTTAEPDAVAYLGVPLRTADGQVLGTFCVVDHRPREWATQQVELLAELAESVMSEIRLRTTAARESTARADAEETRTWLVFLLEASKVLSDSLDDAETLDNAARLVVSTVADWCGIELADENGTRHHLLFLPSARPDEPATRLHYPAPADAAVGAAAVLATGAPALWPSIGSDELACLAASDRHLGLLRDLDAASIVLVPLIARNRTIGVMSFASARADMYQPRHLRYLAELGRRAALAVDNARLYRERDRVARTLQASLLPPSLPAVPGLEFAARYHAVGDGNLVGGDFYDVFETHNGWVFVMGDVRGKGAAAAAVTGLARHTLRATAMQRRSPSRVLRVLNDVLLQDAPDEPGQADARERFCTVVYGLVMPPDDSGQPARLRLASAGHPLPLVVRADGRVETAGQPGTLAGVLEHPTFTDVRVDLAPGDRIVLYTDGVTEARPPGGDLFGEERLAELLRGLAHLPAHEMIAHLEQAVLSYAEGEVRDDIALLVAGVPAG